MIDSPKPALSGTTRALLKSLALAAVAGLATAFVHGAGAAPFVVVQSTTSTQNSGLLDDLQPRFKRDSGIDLRVVAVGTGQALKNARNGDGDVLLVHARAAEERFVAEGHGVARFDLMYNDFVLVGPRGDPARVRGAATVVAALRKIAAARSLFASRGDDSGTHKKEMALWKAADEDPATASGAWYLETGSGMGGTLNVATAMGAYTLTDRASWLTFKNPGDFEILHAGDARLFNQYGVILVNPDRHPHVKAEAGQAFIDWVLRPAGQSAIAAFRLDGSKLFFPNAPR